MYFVDFDLCNTTKSGHILKANDRLNYIIQVCIMSNTYLTEIIFNIYRSTDLSDV